MKHKYVRTYACTQYVTCILVSVSIGDSRGERPAMEELDDTEGLLGGWGAEGDTVQGK